MLAKVASFAGFFFALVSCAPAPKAQVAVPEAVGAKGQSRHEAPGSSEASASMDRYASIDAFCAPIAAEEAGPREGPCEPQHGSCQATPIEGVAPWHVAIVRWNSGSSSEVHEDVAIETARGVFMLGLSLVVSRCDPEEIGPPNGGVSVTIERGALVATYDAFERHLHVAPDSPPSRKQTCKVRCEGSGTPRCEVATCSDFRDEP